MSQRTAPAPQPRFAFEGTMPDVRGEEAMYFAFCQGGEVKIQHCPGCSSFVFYPRSVCPSCFGRDLEWIDAKGAGKVYTYTVQHRDAPGFHGQAPYVIAMIMLDEGVLMMSRLMTDPDRVRIGMPVRVEFAAIGDDFQVPVFVPTETDGD